MIDTKVKHDIVTNVLDSAKKFYDMILEENKGKRFPLSYTKYWNREAVVKKATQTLDRVKASKFTTLARTKIGKGGLIAAGGLVAWNLVQSHIKHLSNPSPAIPRNFDRRYDIIKENMTDFGSPVKLAKTANKTITPYKSSVRRAKITTTKTVTDGNLSLALHKNAIKHHHY